MNKIVGRRVKITGQVINKDWPLSAEYFGCVGVISDTTRRNGVDGPSIILGTISGISGASNVAFFPEELRYLNNKPVVV